MIHTFPSVQHGIFPEVSNISAMWKILTESVITFTIHVPLLDSTKKMVNAEAIAMMKPNAIVLNFARDLLVDEEAMVEALAAGKIKKYVSDFPNPTTVGAKDVL